ncbi:homeobox-leucine zipper family protein [Salix suchowensis]|nr:homeobox-leucine zipper family protein [Salix suchowensis]
MMSRKRHRSNFTLHDRPAPYPKRRPPPPPSQPIEVKPSTKPPPPPAVVVRDLPPDCSVLDLKSRFAIYGEISRIRIDRDGNGYITYRSKDSAEAAITASLDASSGIAIDSKKVQVSWAADPLVQWREGVGAGSRKDSGSPPSSSSKLLRGGIPLSRHGRGNKLASAIVNPTSSSSDGSSVLDEPFKGREIIAYDDIL